METFEPRPFYIIGHNPNSMAEVRDALTNGANAVEPDINIFVDNPDRISVSHELGVAGDPTLVEYLEDLHRVVVDTPHLALVVFDCKADVCTAAHGMEILEAIRRHLTYDNDLKIVLSVGELSLGGIFDRISGTLGPHEGLMIDEEGDPTAVTTFFSERGVANHGFGHGISVMNSTIGPYFRDSHERACALRAATNFPKFINAWAINSAEEMREHIRIGVDGMITDKVARLRDVTQEPESARLIRMAERGDNPFIPDNVAYGLVVHTGDIRMAGTDANVTFTLTGTAGSASKTIDTSLVNRMERGMTNHVTIPGGDIGDPQSITVQRDNAGNAPDWYLERIEVKSFRYGVAKEGLFGCWIESTVPVTRQLV